jgi:hypothetical protein
VSDVIAPSLSSWDFQRRERELAESAKELPTWRLANQARRFLAGVTHELSHRFDVPESAEYWKDVDAALARQMAIVQLGAIGVRTVSSIMSLIASGYEREALTFARILLETEIRGRQLGDDPSGEAARSILQGRSPGSLKSAAHRYGSQDDVRFLDRFAHADVLTLITLSVDRLAVPPERETLLELRPQRGKFSPANQLLAAAHRAVGISAMQAEAFGCAVEIPRWVSGQLLQYKDHPLDPTL